MDVAAALFTVAVTVGSVTPAMPSEGASVAPISILAASNASVEVATDEATSELPSIRRASLTTASSARPPALVPLYATFGVLQGLDIYSTSKSIARGGHEANPVMKPAAGKTAASVAIKAAATAGSIYFVERAWKNHRKGAVILMTAINVASAAVVAHNTRIARAR
jgi:hypothetical protein